MTNDHSAAGRERPPDYWEWHCGRCGDEYPRERESRICESCERHIQYKKLTEGVPCERCDGHGWIYGTICDIQRAMNGRDERCPECLGRGTVSWNPDPDEVLPELRGLIHA